MQFILRHAVCFCIQIGDLFLGGKCSTQSRHFRVLPNVHADDGTSKNLNTTHQRRFLSKAWTSCCMNKPLASHDVGTGGVSPWLRRNPLERIRQLLQAEMASEHETRLAGAPLFLPPTELATEELQPPKTNFLLTLHFRPAEGFILLLISCVRRYY